MAKKRKKKHHFFKYFFIFLTICLSLGLILYPFISNYLFENRADGIIDTIEQTAEVADKSEYEKQINDAIKYNDNLVNGHIQLKDPFIEDIIGEDTAEYNSVLNMTDDGVMGFVEIPCINVYLPVYHGTSVQVLEAGAGHLQGTSLPVGGPSTHSVITGHTGLSRAKLFTDLVAMEEGDIFFLNIMDRKLAYQVDKIVVVKPEELNDLDIEEGKDYCTLLTCTPYGVNTHRLLVRGSRVDYKEAVEKPEVFVKKKTESKWMEEYAKSIVIAASVFLVLMIILIIWRVHQSKKEKQRQKELRRKRAREAKEHARIDDNFKIGTSTRKKSSKKEP